ncbi:hypothetical protein K435DRAFT_804915 [Dendrothele bispora CBS 962.96]|uniref:Uncharacterized protein n=1 Tax=Dendrothele bispora (strain CBS 962.96) TaxID=1314807 RepID=A0A4S8LE42_DENBC|nr:hypothetical protein K435DRAFT_804915 [Dendrothele bispora CBS 962.96]
MSSPNQTPNHFNNQEYQPTPSDNGKQHYPELHLPSIQSQQTPIGYFEPPPGLGPVRRNGRPLDGTGDYMQMSTYHDPYQNNNNTFLPHPKATRCNSVLISEAHHLLLHSQTVLVRVSKNEELPPSSSLGTNPQRKPPPTEPASNPKPKAKPVPKPKVKPKALPKKKQDDDEEEEDGEVKKKGRVAGSTKYKNEELSRLVEIVGRQRPLGGKGWAVVIRDYNKWAHENKYQEREDRPLRKKWNEIHPRGHKGPDLPPPYKPMGDFPLLLGSSVELPFPVLGEVPGPALGAWGIPPDVTCHILPFSLAYQLSNVTCSRLRIDLEYTSNYGPIPLLVDLGGIPPPDMKPWGIPPSDIRPWGNSPTRCKTMGKSPMMKDLGGIPPPDMTLLGNSPTRCKTMGNSPTMKDLGGIPPPDMKSWGIPPPDMKSWGIPP